MTSVSDLCDNELYHVGMVISQTFVRRFITIKRNRGRFILYWSWFRRL